MKSLDRATKWPLGMISTLGWRNLSMSSLYAYIEAILQSLEIPPPANRTYPEDRTHVPLNSMSVDVRKYCTVSHWLAKSKSREMNKATEL